MGNVKIWNPSARILIVLASSDRPLSMKEIAEASGLAYSVVSYTIRDLLYHGYVTERGNKRYQITESGKRLLMVELEKTYSVLAR